MPRSGARFLAAAGTLTAFDVPRRRACGWTAASPRAAGPDLLRLAAGQNHRLGADRAAAIARLDVTLRETRVAGIATNLPLLCPSPATRRFGPATRRPGSSTNECRTSGSAMRRPATR